MLCLCYVIGTTTSAPNQKEPTAIDAQKVLLKETSQAGVAKTVVMLSPSQWNIPVELEQVVRVVDLPLPDKGDRMEKVQGYVDTFRSNPEQHSAYSKAAELSDREVEMVADACAGLTLFQMENTLLMSLATEGTFSKDFILREKREMLKNQGIELIEPKSGYGDVGGLEPAKDWARRYRETAFLQAVPSSISLMLSPWHVHDWNPRLWQVADVHRSVQGMGTERYSHQGE